MIRLRNIKMPVVHHKEQLIYEAAKMLKISASDILSLKIIRKSLDARKKDAIHYNYTVDVKSKFGDKKLLRTCKKGEIAPSNYYKPPKDVKLTGNRPVVVGFGPAGMFAALILARVGLRPVVLERGADASARKQIVEVFQRTGKLDTSTNIQFGEGGAGTFSDGKLNTGVSDLRIQWILEQFVRFGADESILYDAKPHVGTDVLIDVVQNFRREVEALGGEVKFLSQLTDIQIEGDRLCSVEINGREVLPCDKLILAIGHSARDTFEMLYGKGFSMEQKPFAAGVRIEHRQSNIDVAQYGVHTEDLPPADYKLVSHIDGRAVYTFCMCPGGYVVAAASEEGGVVTNGMSNFSRDGENANAAILVTVQPSDFLSDHPLAGMYWQRKIEQKAYQMAGSNYFAPAQSLGEFLKTKSCDGIEPTYTPGVTRCDLHELFPEFITKSMDVAIREFDTKLKGFADPNAILTGPETRSSSPVRILRNEEKNAIGISGLYPCGEGAGYAGGIMSAAIDGIACAEALISTL